MTADEAPRYTLRALRRQRGLSQAQLSRAISVSDDSVMAWENGHREPMPSHLERLATYFGVAAEQIVLPERRRRGEPGPATGARP